MQRRGILVQLDAAERTALAKLAERERRSLNAQAAWLIRQQLECNGLITKQLLLSTAPGQAVSNEMRNP